MMLYGIWGAMYMICAALGVLSLPDWAGILACLAFFVPPVILLCRDRTGRDHKNIRTIALVWLILTVLLIVMNIYSVGMSEQAGDILYYLLVVVSAPMVCGRYWVISLFLWACLLAAGFQGGKKKKE